MTQKLQNLMYSSTTEIPHSLLVSPGYIRLPYTTKEGSHHKELV